MSANRPDHAKPSKDKPCRKPALNCRATCGRYGCFSRMQGPDRSFDREGFAILLLWTCSHRDCLSVGITPYIVTFLADWLPCPDPALCDQRQISKMRMQNAPDAGTFVPNHESAIPDWSWPDARSALCNGTSWIAPDFEKHPTGQRYLSLGSPSRGCVTQACIRHEPLRALKIGLFLLQQAAIGTPHALGYLVHLIFRHEND